MTQQYRDDMRQMNEMIERGEAPPRAGGYSGINTFSASSSDPNNIMNELVIQIQAMNGQILLQEPFRVMWRVDTDNAVDTVFNAWLGSHYLNQYMVSIDMVGGISRNYLTLILPMINALFENGTFEMNRPFNEQEWRNNTIRRMTQMRLRDLELLNEE
jgi:hypothetical protein